MTQGNYDAIGKSLKLFFENERQLINSHLTDLFAMKPVVEDLYEEVKRIANETFVPFNVLTFLGRPTKYWSDIMVYVLVTKLGKECCLD